MAGLYWNTVNGLLKDVLKQVMSSPVFSAFSLVGGTSLSLRLGHRVSVDIDLFTEAAYDSIDFGTIEAFFNEHYPYVAANEGQMALGTSFFVGTSKQEAIKADIYYTDPFIRPLTESGNIRFASMEDVIAMKLDVISRGGRKKDFLDLHELSDYFDIPAMIGFHKERYSYNHDEILMHSKLTDFSLADDDFDPRCLKGKHWELIKLDFVQWMS
jgi:hypothetical protein